MSLRLRRKFPELILRVCEKLLLERVSTWQARLVLCIWGAEVGRGLRVLGGLRLRLLGNLRVGQHVRMRSGHWNYVGASERMAIWVCRGAELQIGNRCALSNTTIVCRQRIDILDETYIGGGCRIYDNDFHQLDPQERLTNEGVVASAAIRIGPRAFLGAHCIVLKGVTIGEGAVIGAGSVVTHNVAPFEIWAGVPARKIRGLARH